MFKFILTLLFIITSIFVTSQVTFAVPYGTGKYNALVPYGGETQLSITTSGSLSMQITPTDSGALGTASGTVTVITSDVNGYKLYIRAQPTTNMVSATGTIPASANGSAAALSNNTWGYNTNGSSNFVGIAGTDTIIRTTTQPMTAGETTTVTYGAKVDSAKPAGAYSTTILYTAVPQTN